MINVSAVQAELLSLCFGTLARVPFPPGRRLDAQLRARAGPAGSPARESSAEVIRRGSEITGARTRVSSASCRLFCGESSASPSWGGPSCLELKCYFWNMIPSPPSQQQLVPTCSSLSLGALAAVLTPRGAGRACLHRGALHAPCVRIIGAGHAGPGVPTEKQKARVARTREGVALPDVKAVKNL